MKIIRNDQVGSIQVRLVKRPTNTAVGVDNWSMVAASPPNSPEAPIVRFLGTDPYFAACQYEQHLRRARQIWGVFQ